MCAVERETHKNRQKGRKTETRHARAFVCLCVCILVCRRNRGAVPTRQQQQTRSTGHQRNTLTTVLRASQRGNKEIYDTDNTAIKLYRHG